MKQSNRLLRVGADVDSGDGPAGGIGRGLEGGGPRDGCGAGAGDRFAVRHRLRGGRRREEVGEYVPVVRVQFQSLRRVRF